MAIELKSEIIPVRLSPSQADRFRRQAEHEGLRLSSWLRDLAERQIGSPRQEQGQAA
jgi:hypothetical protein